LHIDQNQAIFNFAGKQICFRSSSAAEQMAEQLDPFDVTALERSVNDSAVRVSTIWVSYLVFGVYLAITASNVTQRQIFLEIPIRLPTLSIDMPLVAFFLIAPILFVVFHLYVLLQVVLLARTAAAYNEAIENSVRLASDRARIRQRLANTLFAQILAGSPFEREGTLGFMLRVMSWATLVVLPVFVLLVFQYKFLPYHSSSLTWTHRLLATFSLITVLLLWPIVLDGQRSISLKHGKAHPSLLIWLGMFFLVSLGALSFPGEHYLRIADSCGHTYLSSIFGSQVDRLVVPGEDVIDQHKLAKMTGGLASYQGEPMKNFQDRDLSCGIFTGGDFRYSDFRRAKMTGANFERANLGGARLDAAQLRGASVKSADLQTASLQLTDLQGADLSSAKLQNAILDDAHLRGAVAIGAELSGASLLRARLERATLTGAQLNGAVLNEATLEEVDLQDANLSGALLNDARLRAARLEGANLGGASLLNAELEEASLKGGDLRHAVLRRASLRKAQLNNVRLQGTHLEEANLQGATLEGAQLTGAELTGANLSGVSLRGAQLAALSLGAIDLQGADLAEARLEQVSLVNAKLQGASLTRAVVSDADLTGANLQGALLDEAQLERVLFSGVQMEGAKFDKAELRSAIFDGARLNGASFADAKLSGTSFVNAQLEGAFFARATLDSTKFEGSQLRRATISDASLWSATGAICDEAQITEPRFQIPSDGPEDSGSDADRQAELNWRACATKALPPDDHEQALTNYLIELACKAGQYQEYVARGIFLNLDKDPYRSTTNMRTLAKSFLELEGKTCPGAKRLPDSTKKRLQQVTELAPAAERAR
jgi:uncharacterized protein YjbI with pentapeptide repeats